MPQPKTFILTDETVKNSYGFYLLTSGGKLERFKSNPVMLSDHINTNENVIGKWDNIIVEGGQIKASSNFDVDTALGLEISGKVERGYIKGASVGIIPNWDSMQKMGDRLVLTEWELCEASVVPVPSNRNSIAVYSVDGSTLLAEKEVQNLCLSLENKLTNTNLNSKNPMKKIQLSVAALMVLSISAQDISEVGVDSSIVESRILALAESNKKLKEEKEAIELSLQSIKEAESNALKKRITESVELAITEGKIKADAKENFIKLGLTDFDLLSKTLESLPVKKTLGVGVKTPSGSAGNVVSAEEFQKLSLEEQLSFKNEHLEEYKKMFLK